ncbi:hypothetical protein L1887_58704 [Cichorium endivia]|nr:hypothetical protein L1887_58704 [Cichorium endivia]
MLEPPPPTPATAQQLCSRSGLYEGQGSSSSSQEEFSTQKEKKARSTEPKRRRKKRAAGPRRNCEIFRISPPHFHTGLRAAFFFFLSLRQATNSSSLASSFEPRAERLLSPSSLAIASHWP